MSVLLPAALVLQLAAGSGVDSSTDAVHERARAMAERARAMAERAQALVADGRALAPPAPPPPPGVRIGTRDGRRVRVITRGRAQAPAGLTAVPCRRGDDGLTCDTTIAVRPGVELELRTFAGDVVVRGWNRDAVKVVSAHANRERLFAGWHEKTLRIESAGPFGPSGESSYLLQVPAWMPVRVGAFASDVTVSGTRGPVVISTVRGDVDVRGGGDVVDLESIEGEVRVRDARGRIKAGSVNNRVRLEHIVGAIEAQTVNGDIAVWKVDAAQVGASSVNGRVLFGGPFHERGRYAFSSHNGEVIVGLPGDAGVSLSLTSYSGDVRSELPAGLISVGRFRRGQRYSYAIGGGGAVLDLEAFNGAIRLLSPANLLDELQLEDEADRESDDER